MEDLGRRLKRRAKELGLSDAEVARRADLSETRYGHYVGGRREPDLATLVRISRVLGISVGWLLGLEEKVNPSPEDAARERILAAMSGLEPSALSVVVEIVETLARHHRGLRHSLRRKR
jgi:transcriptional regulator with XRE-family HTH domain